MSGHGAELKRLSVRSACLPCLNKEKVNERQKGIPHFKTNLEFRSLIFMIKTFIVVFMYVSIHLFLRMIYFMYICEPEFTYFCPRCRYLPEPEVVGSPETGLRMAVSYPCGCWDLNLGSLKEQ